MRARARAHARHPEGPRRGEGRAPAGRLRGRDRGPASANARRKLEAKNLDLIVANDVTAAGAGFGGDDERGRAAAARRPAPRRAARVEARGGRADPRRSGRAAGGRARPGVARERARRARGRPAGARRASWRASARSASPGRRQAAGALRSRERVPPRPPTARAPPSGTARRPSPRSAPSSATASAAGWRAAARRSSSARATREAELMFVGEAPGADEDEQGLAFVGRAGQLLTDIIEKGMKLRRADVFIANVHQVPPAAEPQPRAGRDPVLPAVPRGADPRDPAARAGGARQVRGRSGC